MKGFIRGRDISNAGKDNWDGTKSIGGQFCYYDSPEKLLMVLLLLF